MFLSFANFYRKFIRNFSKIIVPLTSILQTTDDKALSTLTTKNERNQDTLVGTGCTISVGSTGDADARIDENIKNLSTATKSTKTKKPKMTKAKKLVNSFKINFLTVKAKKTFIHL